MRINVPDDKLKAILLREDYVTAEDIKKAEEYASVHHTRPVDFLIGENLITKELLGQAIAEALKLSYANLVSNPPSKDRVLRIPEDLARQYRIVLFNETDQDVTIASDFPKPEKIAPALQKIFPDQTVKLAYAFPEDIDNCFVNYQKSLETRFSQIIKQHKRIAPEILEEILADAFVHNASDIHFEPQGEDVAVRFRIDGVIQEVGRLPKDNYGNVLNRVKVQSKLRIDEHFSAQDGSMRYEREDVIFDLRTSIIPTVEGEKIVLRLLSSYLKDLSMLNLGLSAHDQAIMEASSKKPFGMILVVGPTGSGKTTTLYAVLSILNQPNVNITTIEDPVEYRLAGVNQIQVNPQTNLTFDKGLRSIVRQDPDIILVGEIRDQVTAEISVNAALTGHLLLSTFHSNDAATAIPRLLDMGIEPFLLASTLEVVIAQRLVRKICTHCRYSIATTPNELTTKYKNLAGLVGTGSESINLYQGKGCSSCGKTGYRGRTAIFEFIPMTPELQALSLTIPSAQQIWDLARSQGAISLFEDGLEKVKSGVTTLEELFRVAEPPDAPVFSGVTKKQKADEPDKKQ